MSGGGATLTGGGRRGVSDRFDAEVRWRFCGRSRSCTSVATAAGDEELEEGFEGAAARKGITGEGVGLTMVWWLGRFLGVGRC